jgi:hypothetical protein
MTTMMSCSLLYAPFGLMTKLRRSYKLQQYSNNYATRVMAGGRGSDSTPYRGEAC